MRSVCAALFGWIAVVAAGQSLEVVSPNGALKVAFSIRDFGPDKACPSYRVEYHGKTVVLDSRLGAEVDGDSLRSDIAVIRHENGQHDETWRPVCAERCSIRDHYRSASVFLKNKAGLEFEVRFRVYDEGAAFCYVFKPQPGRERIAVSAERTEFRFARNHPAWLTYQGQGDYQKKAISDVKPGCERPLVIQAESDCYAALAEARLVDFARMKFALLPGVPNALESKLDGPVESRGPIISPWRVIMVAETPGKLLENNFIFLNLNDPCQLADTSWIKPGKVIREVTLTTVGGKACVDFAVKHGLQYIEYDAGWYGHEYDDKADARAVNVDPKRSPGPLDLRDVIRYGESRGIGVILYVNRRALERQLDEILPLYRSWGVKGIKFGFVNVGSQQWTAWLHDAIRKAAENRLMVDVHDEYRTTGYSRTYPNLMTVEGVRGDEATPSPQTTLTYAFTRYLAGPADNTVCYYDPRVAKNWTRAYQLAKPVCLFSPWHFLFWYDRPSTSPEAATGAGNAKPRIGDDPELEFYRRMPTVWDETRVLHGSIGEFAVIARRSGDSWFIGCMNACEPRDFAIPLDFLTKGRDYSATIYRDDPGGNPTKVAISKSKVDASTVLRESLKSPGGAAIQIEPVVNR